MHAVMRLTMPVQWAVAVVFSIHEHIYCIYLLDQPLPILLFFFALLQLTANVLSIVSFQN